MRIGIVGVGSIGSVLAAGFSDLGHEIIVNDTDDDAISAVPYPSRAKQWLSRNADMCVFAVPTPTTETGGDASLVKDALRPFESTDATIVLRSTMPPGTTQALADEYGLPIVYSPEFLRDRSTVADFHSPDRVVIAGPERERRTFRDALQPITNAVPVFEFGDYVTAEIAKEAHNAFFATKVSFANQVRAITARVGADPEGVMDVVTADSRNTSSHLDPMLGPYGGKCLPKDTEALRLFGQQEGAATPLLDGTVRMNEIAEGNYAEFSIEGNWPDITVKSD